MSHQLDRLRRRHGGALDDTYLPGSIHNESFVFSPSLALAEERGVARGFHPTGTTGALGAAAAWRAATPGGLLEFVTDGAWTKRFHGGWAAHAGIVAAELAKFGMTAPRTAIEGKFRLSARLFRLGHAGTPGHRRSTTDATTTSRPSTTRSCSSRRG